MALMIIAACSGTGKSTIVRALMARHKRLKLSVSHTTRSARPGEVDGAAYHFISVSRFHEMIEENAFVEWAEYAGNFYGTSHEVIRQAELDQIDLLFEVDTVGAAALKSAYPAALSCFILPPSWSELERRLRTRQTETEEVIERRLAVGRSELAVAHTFDYLVVNQELDRAVDEVSLLYRSLLLQTRHQSKLLDELL